MSDKKSFSGSNGQLFETFWSAYPRKEDKFAATSAWGELGLDEHAAEVMAGLARFNAHCQREQTERRFIPLPANWLERKRWKDELPDIEPVVKPLQRNADGLTPLEQWKKDNEPDKRQNK